MLDKNGDTDSLPILGSRVDMEGRKLGGEGSKERTNTCCGERLQMRWSSMEPGNVCISRAQVHTQYHENSLCSAFATEITVIKTTSFNRDILWPLDFCIATLWGVCQCAGNDVSKGHWTERRVKMKQSILWVLERTCRSFELMTPT